MNQFVILSFGVDPLNWPSFIEIGEMACSAPAWCTHGLTLKFNQSAVTTSLAFSYATLNDSLLILQFVFHFSWVCSSKKKINAKMLKTDRNCKKNYNVKTWVRERFRLFTLESRICQRICGGYQQKTYQLKTQSDAGFANAIVFVIKVEKHVAELIP